MSEKSPKRYRIVLRMSNIGEKVGPEAAQCIAEGFLARTWHENVVCEYDVKSRSLILTAENEYDNDGSALMREFAAEYSACIRAEDMEDGDLVWESVKEV